MVVKPQGVILPLIERTEGGLDAERKGQRMPKKPRRHSLSL
jgi:hypothetical protein